MRNFKAVWSVGSAMLILSGAAMAQGLPAGVAFGSAGVSTGCTLGDANTCKVIAGGTNGFVQRQFSVGSKTYIQTVIDDAVKSGFSSEDFVQLQSQGSVQGVASKLTIDQTASGFKTTSNIMAGWAHSSGLTGKTTANIDLSIGDAGVTGQNNAFKSDFKVSTEFDGANATNPNTIGFLQVDQSAGLGATADKQVFRTIIKPAATDQAAAFKMVGDPGTGVSWTKGQMIQATWVGQSISGIGAFSTESVQNIANPASPTATFATSLVDAKPANWTAGGVMTTEFGAAPTF